ncbi:hypothetical protein [Dactylosporangium sp. NPDC051541]|uniref:hypothetical protein n=1 Tax=Dactylosporangium sp. NPDC051541 TaxID=3363977 RepID=UPI0037980247
MADFDDELLTGAFAEFRNEVAPHIKPAGTVAARETVHRRHRVKMLAATTLAVLAIAAPVVAYAAVSGDPHGPPNMTAESASPTPSEAPVPPSAEPSTPATTASSPAAPDGRISQADLNKATLDIPDWPGGQDAQQLCPDGKVKLTDKPDILRLIGDPVYVDIDHDGAQETVALLRCTPQGADFQVLAFDRDAGGKIVTLGRVVASLGLSGREGTDIMTIWAVAAGDNGQVRVDVGEYRPCCGMAQASQHQWRTYGWNGTRFTQTGGPATFGANPLVTDLVITADKVTMTKAADGSRTGTMKVKLHNAAKFATPGRLQFSLRIDPAYQTDAGADCQLGTEDSRSCWLSGLAAGADRIITIKLALSSGQLTACGIYANAVSDGDGAYPSRKQDGELTVQIVDA